MAGDVVKPLLIFDGDCSFCRRWVTRWRFVTGDAIEYEPYQKVGERFSEIPREAFGKSVFLVEPDGTIHSAAGAVFRAFALAKRRRYLDWMYRHVAPFRGIAESAYRLVARNRDTFDWWDVRLTGRDVVPQRYFLTRTIFLRCLALIYIAAFASIRVQIDGLVGSNGILPAATYVAQAREFINAQHLGRPWLLIPSITWYSATDAALHTICIGGMCCAVLLFIGVAPALMLFLLWLGYLSLVSVSGVFLGYQWDYLLLEAGFVAIFFAPLVHLRSRRPPSRMILLLLRWLLFRLMFVSAVVKLVSQDPTWWNLTAMTYHYQTQPIPTPLAPYAHFAPLLFQKISSLLVFVVEGVVPLLYFAPRRPRILALWITAIFQLLIIATGNFGFFNLLTIVLAFTLLDDFSWPRWLQRFRPIEAVRGRPWIRRWALAPIFAVIGVISLAQFLAAFQIAVPWPSVVMSTYNLVAPFGSINSYGLFAVMTTERHEIIVEGSDDGEHWRAYEFKYKPDDPARRPVFCQPHLPRLDWQMWFASLSRYDDETWFKHFEIALLQGRPQVLELLRLNPFPDAPPRYIRAAFYDYRFADRATRARTGAWWTRQYLGPYGPIVSLDKQSELPNARLIERAPGSSP
ncbi:MAG TPA: lipase maturation factor family protein [Tepidisphaeraceae bacterium]|jgi:predicted DCC family thiol-disulfide oxidoreductase YuxK